MERPFLSAIAALVLVLPTSEQASAQWQAGPPGADLGYIAFKFGQIMPRSEMPDGATYENGSGFGAALGWWATANLGLRTTVFRGETQGQHGPDSFSPVGFQKPTVWVYTLEGAARMPFGTTGVVGAPYVSAGLGGKSYRWSVDRPDIGDSASALTGAVGLDLRTSSALQYGVQIEGRMVRTKYDLHGYQGDSPTQNDIVVTVGLSLNR